jgi:1,4-alpha-glucan branching enzyme
MQPKGYLSFVLHAHLPFIRHPEADDILEEYWLYEAITECYIPLISVFDHLANDRIPFRLTMTLTPSLISMLQDPLLQERYIKHIDKLIELSQKEIERTAKEPHYHGLALMYYRKFSEAKEIFIDRYQCDLINAFKEFQELGFLEIITCGATHGFFPILNVNPSSVRAQIFVAVEHYTKVFGQKPKGIWLPECGYVKGLDKILKEAGVQYFFTDTHGIVYADPVPRYNVYAPIYTPSGVAAFGRDETTSKQVWSSKEGYPGDNDYREYYRDIGYDRDFDYIKDYIHPKGIRINTGIKYWRITGKSKYKEAYRPDWAQKRAEEHASDFISKRFEQINYISKHMDRPPIIVAPYDAELYGHWWYEGPMWLDFVIRKIACDCPDIALTTPSQYLSKYKTNQLASPADSSWGHKGYSEFWLNETNSWIYPHLHQASKQMTELVNKFSKQAQDNEILAKTLNQAAVELLLAESSDWPFIMRTGTMTHYAERRIKMHVNRFRQIYNDLMAQQIDIQWLNEISSRDNIFKGINCFKYYATDKLEEKQKLVSSVAINV